MKLYVQSFGCQMSVADGEEMSRPLLAKGFSATASLDDADAALINTCTVRQHAEDKAVSLLGRLREWKEARPERVLIVAGCAAERLGEKIQERFPFVDLVVGAKSIEEYPRLVEQALGERFDGLRENRAAWGEEPATSGSVSAYVTIMRGCNYSCSYCIVPAVRGRELYRPMDAVVAEARRRVSEGAREIMLLGQTVNSYRPSPGVDFADLLRALDALDGLERVRFMSPHPYYLTDRMIDAMAASRKVCRHMHLPLQSGSNPVLQRMRRNYTIEDFERRVDRLRGAMPDVAVTTDVIVGFPGESEGDFARTLDAVRRLDPVSAYCFKFSPRPGTEAAHAEDDVTLDEKECRLRRLLEIVDARMKAHLESWIGRETTVLLEDERFGRTGQFFKATLETAGRIGELSTGVVTGATKTGLRVRPRAPCLIP
ncbi:MAG: tRNA (N6-isopentenyl adenosine(37)-C2)-methylthiotransferase MiaB [Elusimicrobia bacterium]|nr:tRNA (N6-isopentenyl adenosine(37)-C2)-methylthiotransferase MiaB [Elusimicrobiota bacterium]